MHVGQIKVFDALPLCSDDLEGRQRVVSDEGAHDGLGDCSLYFVILVAVDILSGIVLDYVSTDDHGIFFSKLEGKVFKDIFDLSHRHVFVSELLLALSARLGKVEELLYHLEAEVMAN